MGQELIDAINKDISLERRLELKHLLQPSNIDDINYQDKNGDTALICAARKGDKRTVRKLLAIDKLDVNKQNGKYKSDSTALIEAARNGHKEIVEILIKVPNIDINRGYKGKGALMWAAWAIDLSDRYTPRTRERCKEIVRILLKIPNIHVNGSYYVSRVMGELYETHTPLILAIEWASKEMVDILINHPDIVFGLERNPANIRSDPLDYPLEKAISNCYRVDRTMPKVHFEIVDILLKHPTIFKYRLGKLKLIDEGNKDENMKLQKDLITEVSENLYNDFRLIQADQDRSKIFDDLKYINHARTIVQIGDAIKGDEQHKLLSADDIENKLLPLINMAIITIGGADLLIAGYNRKIFQEKIDEMKQAEEENKIDFEKQKNQNQKQNQKQKQNYTVPVNTDLSSIISQYSFAGETQIDKLEEQLKKLETLLSSKNRLGNGSKNKIEKDEKENLKPDPKIDSVEVKEDDINSKFNLKFNQK